MTSSMRFFLIVRKVRQAKPLAAVSADAAAGMHAVLRGMQRRRQRRALMQLDDRLLADIGVSRKEARIESAKPFWKS